jgi:hypothetical protein
MAVEPVAVAVVGAIPATIAALAALVQARSLNRKADQIKEQVTPSNGTPTAKIIEELQADLRAVKDDVAYHVTVQHGRGPLQDREENA